MANEFGRLLKEYRERAKLSQKQLIERIRQARYEDRYSESDISKWEHGRIPPEDVVEELEEILSTPKGLLLKAAGYHSAAEYRRIARGGELKPSPVAPHHEDVRKAIREWLALMRESKPLFNPAALGQPGHFGFGLTWQVGLDGTNAKLVVEDEGFYPLLRSHLAPPVVDADLWSQVRKLRETGTDFLTTGGRFGQQIAKVSQTETGFGIVSSWRHKPEAGITAEFAETISRNALWVEPCTSYAYFEFAIVYMDKGTMVTRANEGVRLLHGVGLDPTFTTLYVSTAGSWIIPQGNQRLICDEAVSENQTTVRAIHFVLQLHSHVIAVGSLDQIRHWREVHQRLMQEYARSPDAVAMLELREKLKSTSKGITAQLERASLHHQFPGTCPLCPPLEGDTPLA